ncbi:hypothetical protein [Nocardioides astragali]|uniref:Uncharacterized protein n=1 Tax=Nocardioides astragali TaxID=1776736 RepID=A0ABW2N930_9ACTN|nr:hypothetical protein [Nocardioides astragali]
MSTRRRVDRLRDGVRRQVGARVAGAAGLDELVDLESDVTSLAEAIRENRELEVPLTAMVDRLEREVAEVLSRRTHGSTGEGMGA